MSDRHDYVALEWVKGEIAETLKQARQALEGYVENPQDPTRMRFCLTYIHQVQGTLQMVEFYGAALLAEEMEQLAQALMDGRASNQGEALEVLMQAILQLPVYLDRIQTARRDLPAVVLPLLNDLRSARGEKLLSETSLFAPDLSTLAQPLSEQALAAIDAGEFTQLLRKLRQMLQLALVGVFRDQDMPTNLGYMARVFARLEVLCKDSPLGDLWPIASAVVEGLASGDISNGSSARMLLREVDKELKRLFEEGPAGMNQAAPDELTKNLLFYVAKIQPNAALGAAPRADTPKINAVKSRYGLSDAFPDTATVDEERAILAGPDRDAMRSVVGALCEELVRVKDSLDLFVRSDRAQVGELVSLKPALKQVADTLAVLGFGQPRKVIIDQIEVIEALAQGSRAPSDPVLMDVAGALLYVEATLSGMVGPSNETLNETSQLPVNDIGQIHQVVIKEARNALEQAKDAIIEFIASQWNHEYLARVPELLNQARGALSMIPLDRAAQLLSACNQYIEEQLLARKSVPNWQDLDTLADAITSVEYYLERLNDDHSTQGELILDVAEESLQSLGYSLGTPLPVSQAHAAEITPDAAWLNPLDEIEVLNEADDQPLESDESELLLDEPVAPTEELIELSGFETLEELDLSDIEPPASEEEGFSLPVLELDEQPLPLDESQPLSIDQFDNPLQWDEAELASMQLPDVQLPRAPQPADEAPDSEKTVTMADVLATPTQAINPPASDIPLSLLAPPADEEPVDEELLEVFIEEAGEVLETIAEYLPKWQADSNDSEALAELRRAFHTLKGSGRMVRALVIGELAWSIENMLNRVLDRSIEPNKDVQQAVVSVVEVMPELVGEFADRRQRQRDDVDALAANAHALAKGLPALIQDIELTPPAETAADLPAVIDAEEDSQDAPEFDLQEIELDASSAPMPEQAEPGEPAASRAEALDPQLLEIFRNEAQAHLDTLEQFLADCAREVPQPVTDDLQRAMHTLKGSSYMAGILPVAEIAAPLEKMLKEFKVNLIELDMADAELLTRAGELFRLGLAQLDSDPLAELPGAAEFIEHAQKLHQERLNAAQLNQPTSAEGETRDPQLINIFLAEGMDILMDAEKLLQRWREHPAERQELTALLDELTTLGRGAEMAELPQIDELCEALLDLYGAVEESSLAVSERFFCEAEQAHEALMNMMDQVAAGLQVSSEPQRVAALRELLNEGLSPDAIGLVSPAGEQGAQVIELDTATRDLADLQEQEQEPASVAQAPVEAVADASMLDDEMVEIFLEEAQDLLESAGQSLQTCLTEGPDKDVLGSLQRDLHTLKGGARMAQIAPIGDLAHELEFIYEGMLDGRFSYSKALDELLTQCHDRLQQLVDQLQTRAPMSQPDALIEALQNYRSGTMPDAPESPVQDDQDPVTPDVQVSDVEVMGATASGVETSGADAMGATASDVTAPIAETPDEPVPAPEPQYPESANTVTLDPDQDSELVEIFLEEGFDIMDSAGASLQDWMSQPDNSLALESLQRDLHTLKGGARMAEISPVGDLAHELEFLYEGLAGGQLRGSEGLVGLLQSCHDSLSDMLEAVREQRPVPDGLQLIAAIKHFRSNPDELVSVPSAIKLTPQAPQTQQAVPAGESDDILDIFLEEADDLLENMSEAIARWDGGRDISASIDDVMRILHTLKGGARLAGQAALGNLAHDLEQHLSDAQQQGEPWPESLLIDAQSGFDGLQAEVEQLRSQLDQADQVNNPPSEPVAPSSPAQDAVDLPIVAVSKLKTEPAPASVLPFVRRSQQAALEETSRRAPQEFVKVPADLLEQLVNLAGETSIFRGRVEQQVSDFSFTLSEMDATIDRVRDQLRRLDTETQAQIISRYQVDAERSGYEDFDPLEMDRYSQLQQLSRALFESASDLLDLKETLAQRTRDAETLLLQQARVNTELQEGLMRTRMVPFDRLVPRLRRIVRQVSGELGKQVEFIVGNADGEMDRTVLERIVAPLEHMLRNAVDHGVETVEKRRAAGKSKQGTIRLNLAREGGDIVISLSDDGAGIQLPAVKRKAVERGLMDEDADLSDYEILQFILEPGFTTAERVTQISGRGVGMDVVHSEVKQLGGSMSIESTLGVGSTFLIRLPFTVSVNRALMVLSGEDLYAVPLNTIEGIVRVSPYELEAYYAPDAPRFEYAGQAYQLRYIGDLLNNGQQPKLVGQSLPLPVILVRSNEHAVAIQVDSLAGSREIVVKSLGAQFAGVHGISGATILGDGRVVVILDLLATIRALHAHQLSNSPRRVSQVLSAEEIESERPTLVMVVDDSITVRKVTSRLLERNGMNVFTAKDGVDAISLLQERKPDILLLDIEMPRMDGFEVATLVRHDPRLQDLPIIMITSRTGDKHRERALGLGVNEYLGKPYQESVLLEHIQRLAGDRSQTGRGAIDNVTDMLT